ncbi:unnamed protein product [Orchesella dallaii]|uniref:Uncharacterized protein n=1 Tax=Orchesella dallaii TaxID=48710 RepID=A0ABP1RLY8_9HEXA
MKLLAALITLLVVVASAKTLKCYVCQYVDGNLPAGFEAESEDSCKTGKTPKDSFSKDCSTLEYESFGDESYAIPKSSGTAKKPRK